MARRYGAATVVAALVTMVALLAPASPAAAAPGITATPATGLLDRQPISVTLTDTTYPEAYVVVDCAVGVGCTPSQAYWRTIGTIAMPLSGMYDPRRVVHSDADGDDEVTVTTKVRRQILVAGPVGDPVAVNCSTQPCTLGLVPMNDGEGPDPAPLATTVPLGFETTGTYVWPDATVATTSRAPLGHRGVVDVVGSGFDPDWVHQPFPYTVRDDHVALTTTCGTGQTPECQWEPDLATLRGLDPDEVVALQPDRIDVEDDGTIDDAVAVSRFLRQGPHDYVDCAQSDCTFVVHQPGQVRSTPVPLDVGPEWAPWSSPGEMVAVLDDIVGEGRTDDGQRGWLTAQLASDDEAGSVQNLIWYLANEAYVSGTVATLYSSLVPGRPDTAGLRYWIDRLGSGTSRGRMADTFANTPAVRATHAQLDDAAFVELAYTSILQRASDAGGKQYWIDRLAGGMPRYRLLSSFALTPEAWFHTRNRRIITASALGLRDRAPTTAEWTVAQPRWGSGELTADRIFTMVAVSDVFRVG